MTRLALVSVFVFLLTLGCKKEGITEKIDSDIIVQMVETVERNGRTLQLHCATEAIYPCYNYSIVHTHKKNSNRISLDFKGVYKPDICLTAIGPAQAIIDLGSLSNGKYELKINVNGKDITGKLIVTSDKYVISLDNQRQIRFANDELIRIPE